MAMGSINVPDDESIGSEMKTKGQLSLFARQKGKPLPGQSVCAGQMLLSNSAPNIPSESNEIVIFSFFSVKRDPNLPYPAESQEDKIKQMVFTMTMQISFTIARI